MWIALLAGALSALGQAPLGLWPVTLAALAAVFLTVASAPDARSAALRGWLAGSAQFALALSWIVEPFLVQPEVHGWMAPFALILMAGGLALFWALPAALAHASFSRRRTRLMGLAAALVAAEALRGILFTGLPWAMLGHVWIGTPVDQLAALGGALALSALTTTLACLLALAWLRGLRKRALVPLAAGALVIAMSWGWGTARLADPVAPRALTLRLVQANIPQHLKWRRELMRDHFEAHLALSRGADEAPADLVIWPETAVPFFLDQPGDGLRLAAEAAGAPVFLGIDRRGWSANGAVQYFNSAALIGPGGTVEAVYDKHHLVPFGEYIPLIGAYAQENGIAGLAARLFSGYTPGPGPVVLDIGEAGRVLPLICYEAIFPRNLRTPVRPDWIAHLTNDAWFGALLGPQQHLAQTRLRAIETGLPIVRAANTGISAVIDAHGRIVSALELGQRGAIQAALPGALPPTPFARMGEGPWYIWALLLALFMAFRARRPGRA